MIHYLKEKNNKYFLVDYLFLFMSALLGFYLNWRVQDIVAFCAFLWFVLKPIPPQKLIAVSAILLLSSLAMLVIKKQDFANDFATYSFYAFTLASFVIILDYLKLKREFNEREV